MKRWDIYLQSILPFVVGIIVSAGTFVVGIIVSERTQESTDINARLRECQELSKELNSQYSVEISDQGVFCVINVDSGSYKVRFKDSELRGALRGIGVDRNIKVCPCRKETGVK